VWGNTLYRELFESSPDGVLLVDPDTQQAIEFNDAACRQLGYTREEFRDLRISDYEALQTPEEISANLQEGRRKETTEFETLQRTKTGEIRHVHVWSHPIEREGRVAFYVILRDITAKRQMAEALRNSEQRLAYALEATSGGVWDWNMRTGEVIFSDQWISTIGYSSDEVRATADFRKSLVHPDDWPRVWDALQAHFSGRTPAYRCEYRLRLKSGEYRHNEDRGRVVEWDRDGSPVRMVGAVSDITERVLMEQAVSESESKHRALFETAENAILVMNAAAVIVDCNTHTERLLGRPKASIIGCTALDFSVPVQPDGRLSADKAAQHINTALAGHPQSLEWRAIRNDGTPFDTEVTLNRVAIGADSYLQAIVRDVSARKRMEDALRKSEEFLAQSQRLAHLGHWIVELETATLTWSDELYRILGVSPDACMTIDTTLALIHPHDRSAVQSWGDSVVSEKQPGSIEFRVYRPDGTIRVVKGNATVQVNAEHKPIRIVGTTQDITESKQTEEAQRRSLQLLQQTGRVAKVGGWELDVVGQTLHWTEELFRIHEVDPGCQPSVAEALQYYAPGGQPVMTAAMQAAIDAGTPFDVELPLVTAHGRRIWVRALGTAERHEGRTTRVYGALQDITDRRAADDLHRLQSGALDAAADAIVITDRAGVIEWVNPAFTQLTGYTLEEAVGKNPRDLLKSGKHTPAFFADFWATILAGRTWHGEIINRKKDGSLYTESQTVTPITDGSDTVTHFVGIKQDITEHRRLEAQFRQAQKMETVGLLTSGIAHDFNNLLTVINGMSEIVLERVGQDDPMHADVKEIQRAGKRAASLTRQLLAFSRQQVLAPKTVNLNAVVTEMESLLRRLLGEDIDLAICPTPGLANIKADVGQLEQVISNLTVNARDAMPQGGRLTIETRHATIDENFARQHGVEVTPGPYVLLVVTDSGIGMDEATRVRIFEPFFTTKGPGEGTGLGLSTVYGIVKQSLGFVWAYSEIGQGTSFKIYLPQVPEATGAAQRAPTVGPTTGTETILLVEDNEGLRKLTTRFLEAAGYTVVEASAGEEALRLLERHAAPIHLVLSDVVMPGMSGRQLAERLAPTHPDLKVLFMSGYTSDTIVRHGVLDSQVAFLDKPFTAAALLRKVRDVLESRI
jgi:PAS domain S-box-containing protein